MVHVLGGTQLSMAFYSKAPAENFSDLTKLQVVLGNRSVESQLLSFTHVFWRNLISEAMKYTSLGFL